MTRVAIPGFTRGRATYAKMPYSESPSILAASITSSDILWMPDRKNTIRYHASFQTYITAMAGSTVLLLDSTFMGFKPMAINSWSKRPFFAI